MWARFADAALVLAEPGRLGAVRLQYPQWFTPSRMARSGESFGPVDAARR